MPRVPEVTYECSNCKTQAPVPSAHCGTCHEAFSYHPVMSEADKLREARRSATLDVLPGADVGQINPEQALYGKRNG